MRYPYPYSTVRKWIPAGVYPARGCGAGMTENSFFRLFTRLSSWLREYPLQWLRMDLVAGVTTSAVVILQAMS